MPSTTVAPIVITGPEARDIRTHVNVYVRPAVGHGWAEVQAMRECDHGCKLHVRVRGCVLEYALIHYAGYGCPLDTTATRVVPVRVVAGTHRP